MDSAVLANEDLCKVLNAGQMNGMSQYRVWPRSAYRSPENREIFPSSSITAWVLLHQLRLFPTVMWADSLTFLLVFETKTYINKLRNCAACYVCSCSLFWSWPWDCDTAHAVFPMNGSWHAKDWSGLIAQMLIRLINPDTFQGWALSE